MAAYNDLLLSRIASRMDAGEDSSSFWQSSNFELTTQRVEDGRRLCKDLAALLEERADIEKDYAKQLHGWADKWRDVVERGPEYGTTGALWKGFLTEAAKLADLHLKMKDKLCKDVIVEVKDWEKAKYHKSKLKLKEKKQMEVSFKKAQQLWKELLHQVEDAKNEYHKAVRKQRSTSHQLSNALADTDMSLRLVKMISGRSIVCKDKLDKAKGKYERALREIHLYMPKYIEDMTAIFDKTQEMEGQRLEFFKKIMFSVYRCLDLSQNPNLQQIYEEFLAAIDNADPGKDLQWWSRKYGAHMDMKCPTFEEYQVELRGKSDTEVASGTTLTNWRAVAEDSYESSEESAHDQTDNSGGNTSKPKKKTKTDTKGSRSLFDEDASSNDTDETFVDLEDSTSSESNSKL